MGRSVQSVGSDGTSLLDCIDCVYLWPLIAVVIQYPKSFQMLMTGQGDAPRMA
jgi:hypothetical protein